MKLLIYSGTEKFVSSGIDSKKQVVEGVDLTQTIEGAYDVIEAFDFIENSENENPLEVLISRLRSGGTLSIQGVESTKVSELLLEGRIDANTFSGLLVSGKTRASKVDDIVKQLESKSGYDVQFAGINGINYIVEILRK